MNPNQQFDERGVLISRQQRRFQAAIRRRGKRPADMGHGKTANGGHKFRLTHVNWYKRIAKEMKDCAIVIENVTSGRLDRVMGFK